MGGPRETEDTPFNNAKNKTVVTKSKQYEY